jgi:hypothetical protein
LREIERFLSKESLNKSFSTRSRIDL